MARPTQEYSKKLGADVCAILGSTDTTAEKTAQEISLAIDAPVRPFSQLQNILALPLDAVSICTPPALQFAQIMACFENSLPVFCEKPLFWDAQVTVEGIEQKLRTLENHPRRALFVNTSNPVFIDAIADRMPSEISSFVFSFHTQGPFKGRDIATDLFPHGISLLLRLFGVRPLTKICHQVGEAHCRSTFNYGNCAVAFDFQQNPTGPKRFEFKVNSREFCRVQEGRGSTYRVYLMDTQTQDKIQIPDPFEVYIANFLRYCQDSNPEKNDPFADAAANLRLMTQALISGQWPTAAAHGCAQAP